ncbi:MAG: PstS family phosphate ABC transporter substrate-binding protein [Planctomycetota bacterium]|nr:PstS family phosphate ABC transporter substrate-binding protein [Planctomycetota bacterium]
MRTPRFRAALALGRLAALAIAVVSLAQTAPARAQSPASLSGVVKIDGSSTVYPITEAIAEEFKKVAPQVNVTVGISGTGGGFKRFLAGETDISDASRPIKKEEFDRSVSGKIEFIELPVAFDGLSIVVHPQNDWVDQLTLDEIRRLFTDGSTVKKWNDIRPNWPDRPIKIFSPGTDSGTFDYFREVVVGNSGAIRGDMSVSEDDNVLVKGVAGDRDAIGFFGCAFYFENRDKLKVVPVDAGKGPIEPTHETIENGSYAPFSRPLFIYVNRRAAERPEVKAFVSFYLQNAGRMAESVGYVKLPNAIYSRAGRNFTSRITGTQFLDEHGEHKLGSLSELYK